MKMGVQNIKEVVVFTCELVKGFVDTFEDKKISITDLVHFAAAGKAFPAAIADLKEVKAEYADLDDAERLEIITAVKEKFDIPDDLVEKFIEKCFRAGIYLVDAIETGFEVFAKKE